MGYSPQAVIASDNVLRDLADTVEEANIVPLGLAEKEPIPALGSPISVVGVSVTAEADRVELGLNATRC